MCQSGSAALQTAVGGSSGWGWGIAQKSHHWEGDLEMLKGAKLLKQTWQMNCLFKDAAQAWPIWVPAGLFAWAVAACQALAGIVGLRR